MYQDTPIRVYGINFSTYNIKIPGKIILGNYLD